MKTTLSCVLLSLFFWGHSQSISTNLISTKDIIPGNWTHYFDNGEIQIKYQKTICDPEMGYDQETILLSIENKTNSDIQVQWHMILEYAGLCKTCAYPDEYSYTIKLSSNETKTGVCSIYGEHELKIFSKFNEQNIQSGESLSSFQLGNLSVSPVVSSN